MDIMGWVTSCARPGRVGGARGETRPAGEAFPAGRRQTGDALMLSAQARAQAPTGGPLQARSQVLMGGSMPAAAAHESYVRGLYQELLGREADPAGLADFTARLAKGESPAAIREAIMASFEYRRRQVVLGLYRALLDREPDPAGYADHMRRLAEGQPLHAVRAGFLDSAEFQAGAPLSQGQLSNEAYLTALYQGLLGREPDPAGFADHLGKLAAGESRASVRDRIMASHEYLQTLPPPPPPPPPPADPLAGMSEAALRHLGATDRRAFLEALRPAAEEAERRYGVPAAVTLAQAAHETYWGAYIIDGYNLFGVKGQGPAGSTWQPTSEYLDGEWVQVVDAFAAYHSFTEAVMARGDLFHNGYYDHAMAQFARDKDPVAFAHNLTGIYATDPRYGAKLEALMREYDLV